MDRKLRTIALVAIGVVAAAVAYAGDRESAAIEATVEWLALPDEFISRELLSAEFRTTLPGAPDGPR